MKQPVPWTLLQPQPCVSPAIPGHPLQIRSTWSIWARFESPTTPHAGRLSCQWHEEGQHETSPPRSLSLLQFPIPSGLQPDRSPMVPGMEPPSHSWWPHLQQDQPALWSLSQGPQHGSLGENTAFYRLWGKRITGFFFFPLLPFPLCRFFGICFMGMFFPLL